MTHKKFAEDFLLEVTGDYYFNLALMLNHFFKSNMWKK